MRPFRRVLPACVLVVLFAACRASGIPGPPAGLPHAAATPSCGPADGPAVAIYLAPSPVESANPPTPYVHVYVWQSPQELVGRSWVLAGSEPQGSASFHPRAGTPELATSGTLTVNGVAADKTIEGSIDLAFPSAGRIRGGFRAVWIPQTMLCG